MFGDNLSFISDTTIAACNGQGCKMTDKFKENFFIALPAAVASLAIICMLSVKNYSGGFVQEEYHLIQTIPYICLLYTSGPLEYMAAIFRKLADSDEDAMQLALEFYGPMYLLYSVYDGAEEKESVSSLLVTHIDHFIAKVEAGYRKKERTT